MADDNTAPVVTDDVAVGQADTESSAKTQEEVVSEKSPQDYDAQFSEFIAKKGWSAEDAPQQLLKSYTELEGKLGNWKDIETKASQFDELYPQYQILQQKAAQYDEFVRQQQAVLPEPETVDFSKAPTELLAQLWTKGKVGLADLPPERQYEVQRAAARQDMEFERGVESQAKSLMSKYPILQDERVTSLVADKIEKGTDPEKAIQEVQELMQMAEKKAEERIKADMEKLKNADLESSSSPVSTRSNKKVSSVFEAYQLAKGEQN